MNSAAVVLDFRRTRARVSALTVGNESGVYAVFTTARSALAPFAEPEDGLIYIGRSTDLAVREFDTHFDSSGNGFSTVRRSLGAILKQPLSLRAVPRSSGSSESNVRNFIFTPDGEERLTDWMLRNLEVAVHVAADIEQLEPLLIRQLRPLLNLNRWPNPDRAAIKRLRKMCADEARTVRSHHQRNK